MIARDIPRTETSRRRPRQELARNPRPILRARIEAFRTKKKFLVLRAPFPRAKKEAYDRVTAGSSQTVGVDRRYPRTLWEICKTKPFSTRWSCVDKNKNTRPAVLVPIVSW